MFATMVDIAVLTNCAVNILAARLRCCEVTVWCLQTANLYCPFIGLRDVHGPMTTTVSLGALHAQKASYRTQTLCIPGITTLKSNLISRLS
jgi:hypothetical protein